MKYTAKIRDTSSPETFTISYVDDYWRVLKSKSYQYGYGETLFTGYSHIQKGDVVIVSEKHIDFRYNNENFDLESNRGIWETLTYQYPVPNTGNKLAGCITKDGKMFAIPYEELIFINKILLY